MGPGLGLRSAGGSAAEIPSAGQVITTQQGLAAVGISSSAPSCLLVQPWTGHCPSAAGTSGVGNKAELSLSLPLCKSWCGVGSWCPELLHAQCLWSHLAFSLKSKPPLSCLSLTSPSLAPNSKAVSFSRAGRAGAPAGLHTRAGISTARLDSIDEAFSFACSEPKEESSCKFGSVLPSLLRSSELCGEQGRSSTVGVQSFTDEPI